LASLLSNRVKKRDWFNEYKQGRQKKKKGALTAADKGEQDKQQQQQPSTHPQISRRTKQTRRLITR